MITKVLKITIGLAFLYFFYLWIVNLSSTVQAVGDLSVDWGVPEGTPIFVVDNFAPAEKEVRKVQLTNGAETNLPISIKGVEKEDLGLLAEVLEIEIRQPDKLLYSASLRQFLLANQNQTGIFLFNLGPRQKQSLTISLYFKSSAGNDYQNKKIVFDLKMGLFYPVPPECRNFHFESIVYGTNKSDRLKGTKGSDLIFGLAGNDKIEGGDGNDCLVGGEGNDHLFGGRGNDVLLGGPGRDKAEGGSGRNICQAEVTRKCQ